MIELVLKAIGLGLLLVIMIGPVFFSLMQTSIKRGFRAGGLMALGITLSDIFYILISFFGLTGFLTGNSQSMAMMGGLIFIGFGIYSIARNKGKIDYLNHGEVEAAGTFRYIFKGFVINAVSPFVVIFWIVTVSTISSQYQTGMDTMIFFVVVVATVFCGDLIKAALSHKLKQLITVRLIRILNYLIGAGLIGLGIRLILVHPEF